MSPITPAAVAALSLPQTQEPQIVLPDACAHKGCVHPPKYQPLLELYARRRDGGRITRWAKPAIAELALVLCDGHAKSTTADDLISTEGWQQLSERFTAVGLMPPDRHLTKLKLAEIIVDNTKG